MPVCGLIDGNSFYCSAERAFVPKLRGVPLVVLSNNDGCAIARTSEAKGLGIKMGEAWHLAQRRPECKDIGWRTSNYPLYGDMSCRMYEVLAARVPQVELYSIDEMFLDLARLPNLPDFCRVLCDDVRRLANSWYSGIRSAHIVPTSDTLARHCQGKRFCPHPRKLSSR